jgi:hypothetical protein
MLSQDESETLFGDLTRGGAGLYNVTARKKLAGKHG